MKYENTVMGIFIKRPNRFIAHVEIGGTEEIVHVKNTGRCAELLLPGARVVLEEGKNIKRKTKYSIIAVYKNNVLFNMDSQAPNAVAAEALAAGLISEIGSVDFLKREVSFDSSRFDLYYEQGNRKGFIEVKGVTLEENGIASFPDAPTLRGSKHMEELIKAKTAGYEASVLFVIQMEGMHSFCPNKKNDPLFTQRLKEAAQEGVHVLVYDCKVDETSLVLNKAITNVTL